MTLVTSLIKKSSTLYYRRVTSWQSTICRLSWCHPPVEIWSWFQTQVHQVLIHPLVQSTSPGSDPSSTCWHRCWQPPWPWRGGSSGSGSPPNSSFSLLTINTADEKAALSWLDLAWEVARRMQSHPKSWIPHLSGEAAALTVGCPLNQRKVLPASSPSCQENSLQFGKLVIICRKTTTQFCCFCWSWLREWSTAYSIINNNHYHSGLNSYLLWFYHHLSQYQTGYR